MEKIIGKNISGNRMKTFKIFIYLSILFIAVFVSLAGFILYGLYQFYMPPDAAEAKNYVVEKGEGMKEIGRELQEQKIIRSSFWFEVYIWLSGEQNKLQAGRYSFKAGQSMAEVAENISGGKITENAVWVTIPEGFTSAQINERLIAAGLGPTQIIGQEKINEFADEYEFFAGAPGESGLEGFLFPDTYKFEKDATQKEILQKMLDNFGSKLTQNLLPDIASQGKTIFEIVTMASILEKEGKTAEDKKIISGIFWKRLADNYPLESDATLSYIFGDKEARHTIEQTKIDSSYNTYKYAGLPPGPINNPGLDAILAAVYPEKSDYYYFLTKPDTGEAVFAKTLQEHNANKIKYLK